MKIAQEALRKTGQRKFGMAQALKVQKASTLKDTPRDLSMTTDHMLCVPWTDGKGWAAPEIKPYGSIKVPTTATVLHYGMSCFDGFIVARNRETGELQAKDLDKHIDRLNAASRHLDLPAFDKNELKHLISELLKVEARWVPEGGSNHVYVRMQHFSLDPTL